MAYPVEIPHLAWPIERGENGRLKVVEQDTPEHILACENMIVRCPVGYRSDRPEFGWQFPTFRQAPINPEQLLGALRRWEPRSNATAEEVAELGNAANRDLIVESEVSFNG